jgi:hypothetical protein
MHNWWKRAKIVFFIIAIFVLLFFIAEVIRTYQTFYSLHPVAGFLFAALLIGSLGWLLGRYILTSLMRHPVLIPPEFENQSDVTNRQLHAYIKYLIKYINRLGNNDILSDEDRTNSAAVAADLKNHLNSEDKADKLLVIAKAENEIKSLLCSLDENAEKEVRKCTRDVMVGVMLSPYKAADLLIVLYRNLVMITKITRIYNTRPRVREQLKIMYDTICIVATVNYINMGKNLIEGFGAKVPFIGKHLDDIAQGIGAGFMTSVAGHAAMERCRAFKGWNEQQAKDNIREHLKQFFVDVKNTFIDDVLDMVIKRVGAASKETLDKARNGIAETLEETGNILDKFVKKPVAASVSNGAKAVKTGSSKSKEAIEKLVKNVSEGGAKSFKYIKDKTNLAGKGIVAVTKKSSDTTKKSLSYAKNKSSEIAGKVRSKFKKPDDQS